MTPLPPWLERLDQDAFLALHGLLHRLPLHEGFRLAIELGNGWVLAPLLVGLLALGRDAWRGARLAALLVVVLGTVSAAVHALKVAFPRDRPYVALRAAFDRGEAELEFDDARLTSALPSGHTATVVALAGALAWWAGAIPVRWRRRAARLGLLVLALGTGLGRVYAGAHFPLDVLAGAALGLLSVGLARACLGRWLGPGAGSTSG